MIECEGLTRYYGTFAAVRDVNLNIPRGAICALTGPNGAGKSTIMRMLCTLLTPTLGRARIAGRDVVRDTIGVRRLIGYLPETFPLYDDMLVEKYLQFFAKVYGLDRDTAKARVEDFLKRLGLTEKRDAKIQTLSRGMRQRLGVAKSFLHDPEVVFLDEPASGLDPVARTELREFLKYQQHLGKTVVVSSHVLKELADFCSHLAIVQSGRLVEFGPIGGAEGVLAKYAGHSLSGRRYALRVLRDAARLEMFLTGIAGPETPANLVRRDLNFTFEFPGGEEAAAALLGKITAAGFLVAQFTPEEPDLEAVYRRAAGSGGSD